MEQAISTGRPRPKLSEYAGRLLGAFADHPLSAKNVPASLLRAAVYQVAVRIFREVQWPWIGSAKLAVSRGMRGASGNIYSGLAEYQEMGFFLHFLRPGDLFFDLGANIGSYTVLASKVCGARTLAVEPDPDTLRHLWRNIDVNGIGNLVSVEPYALADKDGVVEFWVGWDTSNRIATPGDGRATRTLPARRLDGITSEAPIAIKMDLEGGEDNALLGASRIINSPALQAIAIETVGESTLTTLHNAGFLRVYYDPATREISTTPNSLKVSDAIFVRDLALCQERVRMAQKRRVASQLL